MNNKEKIALAMGTFIILALVGFFLMKKDDDVTFYSGEEKTQEICVYVVGEVNEPGIFNIEDGTRIYEVIEMAGGATEDADVSRINLSKILDDEEKISVPKKVIKDENSHEGESKNVNINSASVEKLSTLNGIGKSTAERIVRYREENGYFNTIEDLMNVSGIGEIKFNSIKDNIEV